MPTPAVKILVDFDQDGDWSESINDITSDVRRFNLSKGKDVQKQRAAAATLNLIVSNDDHKYSPSFAASPLHPYVISGPDLWCSVGYPVDTFVADDTTTLTGRKPTYDDLFDAWAGDTGDFEVDTNKLKSSSAANLTAVLDFTESDCWVAVWFTRTGSNSGLILRWSNASNYILVRSDGNTLRLSKVDGGVTSDIATATHTWGSATEKRIDVELHGTAIRVYIDHTLYIDTTSSFNQTAKKHGIGGRATNTSDRWNDFGGWRTVFFGRIDNVAPRPEHNAKYAYLRCFDDMERMKLHQVYRTAPAAPTTAAQILNEILDAVNADSNNRIIDTGATLTADSGSENVMGDDGLTEAYQLQDDDVGFFYIDGGIYRYEAVDHRESAPHTTPSATWRAARLDNAETDIYFSGLTWEDGKELVENEGYFFYYKQSLASLAELWRLQIDDVPPILDTKTLTFIAVGQGDAIASPFTPIPASDFTVNTQADGGGTDLTIAEDSEQGTVSATGAAAYTLDDTGQDFTDWNNGKHVIVITDNTGTRAIGWIAATNPDGDGTRVAIKTNSGLGTAGYASLNDGFDETDTPLTYDVFNITAEIESGWEGNFRRINLYNASGSDGFVTLLRLRGKEGTKSVRTAARFESDGSQTLVGRRRIEHQAKHIDRWATALDRVTERIIRRQDLREHLKIRMNNGTRSNLMQILHRSISDRIRVFYPAMGIITEGFIERQELEMRDGGKFLDCTWDFLEDPSFVPRMFDLLTVTAGLSTDTFGRRTATLLTTSVGIAVA